MSRPLSSALAILLLLRRAPCPSPRRESDADPAVPAAGEVVPGEVIVKWRDAGEGTGDGHGHAACRCWPSSGRRRLPMPEVVSTAGRPVAEVVAELRADPAVEYAEPNYVVALADDPAVAAVGVNDPKTGPQYSLDRMRVRDAWSPATTGSVRDRGRARHRRRLRPSRPHRARSSRLRLREQRRVAADDNGHGTWVAGIIAANAERRDRDRRHQLARPHPAGQDHERQWHRRHLRPDRRASSGPPTMGRPSST